MELQPVAIWWANDNCYLDEEENQTSVTEPKANWTIPMCAAFSDTYDDVVRYLWIVRSGVLKANLEAKDNVVEERNCLSMIAS